MSQTQCVPIGNENYFIPNRLNQSTMFSYTNDDHLLNNHNEPEFIHFEPPPNVNADELSPLSGEVFQPDEIFQLDQPIRYHNNTFNVSSSPQTLLDLGSGTIETKINLNATQCFNDMTDSFYNLNEDSTSSSQNNDSSVCGYPTHIVNNNNIIGSGARVDNSNISTGLSIFNSSCDAIGHVSRMDNSLHIQYEHPVVKSNREKYGEMVVDNEFRKSFEFYQDDYQTFTSNSEHTLTDKLSVQSNGPDLSLTSLTYQQQFMEPCFDYASNEIDSNVTYKMALDSGQ